MTYDEGFYEDLRQRARTSAEVVVPMLIDLTRPTSVVDVGCGTGGWLAELVACGVGDVVGVDFEVPEDKLDIAVEHLVRADLTRPLDLGRSFDLALCLEVAEHLDPPEGEALVASLVRLAPVVAFSAAAPHQGGTHHVNEQWPEYWARRFEEHGFLAIDCLRRALWRDERVEWWYSQNLVLYVSDQAIAANDHLRVEHERWGGPPLSLVHPTRFAEIIDWITDELSRPSESEAAPQFSGPPSVQ